jgi:hypothetical protein
MRRLRKCYFLDELAHHERTRVNYVQSRQNQSAIADLDPTVRELGTLETCFGQAGEVRCYRGMSGPRSGAAA